MNNSTTGDSSERDATVHCVVRGRVQGVFFRASTKRRANELGLAGWVRNLPDGRVEAVFRGSRSACQRALEFVRTGPPAARVDEVKATWEGASRPDGDEFEIR